MRAVALTLSLDLQPAAAAGEGSRAPGVSHRMSQTLCTRSGGLARPGSANTGTAQGLEPIRLHSASRRPRRPQAPDMVAQHEGQMRPGMLRGADSHSPDLMLHAREDPTGDGDQQRLRRDGGGAALPARGRGGRSTGEPGATNRGRGMRRAFLRPRGPAASGGDLPA